MTDTAGRLELGLLLRSGEQAKPAGRVVGWSELRDMSVMAEDVGFDTIWMADHLIVRNAGSVVMPPGESRGPLEAWTVLSAIAAVTSRVTLGPFVACNSFREPALLAKMADTLDEVSGGRVLLGLGAGWHEPEYTAFGFPFDHLAGRFEEALKIIVPLLKGETVTFHGTYYNVDDAEGSRPRGPRPGGPPIWIGAKQPRMMRLVARYADAYNTVWHPEPSVAIERYAALEAACREVGRDPSEIRRTSGTTVLVPNAGDAPDSPPTALTGSAQEIAEQIWAFHTTAGVSHMTVVLDPWTVRGVEMFGKVIDIIRSFEKAAGRER